MMEHMYPENRRSINAFVGCLHDCVYCKPSFQRQAKRQKKRCLECYTFKPHFHGERLAHTPPKTGEGEFLFFPSMGDPCFAMHPYVSAMLTYADKYLDRTFWIQTKNPYFMRGYTFPPNVILAITLETDKAFFYNNPSRYCEYGQISKAPDPYHRYLDFKNVDHPRKAVVVEPILSFDLGKFVSRIRDIKPQIVYVGYDNHHCGLPEPTSAETIALIEELKKFTDVRTKLLRKAWYEP